MYNKRPDFIHATFTERPLEHIAVGTSWTFSHIFCNKYACTATTDLLPVYVCRNSLTEYKHFNDFPAEFCILKCV